MHKNLSAPYKPQPINEAFEQMSFVVPSLRKVYAGGPAMAAQMQIKTGNTLLTFTITLKLCTPLSVLAQKTRTTMLSVLTKAT